MRYIHSKKIILFFISIFMAQLAFSQAGNVSSRNYLDFQNKPYYFGIYLGLNNSKFNVFKSERFILNDTISIAEGGSSIGANINLIGNLKIGKYFDFRFIPGFSFSARNIFFTRLDQPDNPLPDNITSVFVEMPFQIRYKSEPYKDMRLFFLAGMKYSYDLNSNARSVRNVQNLLRISPHDFSVEIGAGIQLFFPFFIFSPEIKITRGLGNMLIFNPGLEKSNVLEKVLNHSITIGFSLEG